MIINFQIEHVEDKNLVVFVIRLLKAFKMNVFQMPFEKYKLFTVMLCNI